MASISWYILVHGWPLSVSEHGKVAQTSPPPQSWLFGNNCRHYLLTNKVLTIERCRCPKDCIHFSVFCFDFVVLCWDLWSSRQVLLSKNEGKKQVQIQESVLTTELLVGQNKDNRSGDSEEKRRDTGRTTTLVSRRKVRGSKNRIRETGTEYIHACSMSSHPSGPR